MLRNHTHLHSPGLDPGLVAELDQSHQHGEAKPANQDVEDPRHVAQTERARLVLLVQKGGGRGSGTTNHGADGNDITAVENYYLF